MLYIGFSPGYLLMRRYAVYKVAMAEPNLGSWTLLQKNNNKKLLLIASIVGIFQCPLKKSSVFF